jgi:hypothetical protein
MALAQAAGLDLHDLRHGDGGESFERSPDVDVTLLAAIPWTILEALLDAYGDALALVVDYVGVPDQAIDVSMGAVGWDQYRSSLEPTGQYRIRININKSRLLDLARLSADNIVHYFFASSLLELLNQGLPSIEKQVWRTADSPALVLVGDTDLHLTGPMLRVSGGVHLPGAAIPPPGLQPNIVSSLRDARQELVSVEAPAFHQLTPWHLEIDSVTTDSPLGEDIRAKLVACFAQLCLVSVCDRARPGQTSTAARLEFRGAERLASVTIDSAAPRMRAVITAEAQALRSIVAWCYDDVLHPGPRTWTQQRLQFVQVRVARLVGAVPEADRLDALFRALIEIDATKDVFWKAFLEETVSDYLDHLRELDDVVDATADAYGDRTSAITDKLTTSMLAAVAALIGSFIAAAFSKPFNADLFRIGMWTYAAYLAIFPAGLGLWVQFTQYQDVGKRFAHRRDDFDMLLGAPYVLQRVGARINDARHRCQRFLVAALALYTIVVVAAIVAGAELPNLISKPPTPTNVKAGHAVSVGLSDFLRYPIFYHDYADTVKSYYAEVNGELQASDLPGFEHCRSLG